MDYVTRQFINLTKKLRKDIRKGLTVLHRDFQKHTNAIGKQVESHSEKQEAHNEALPQPLSVDAIVRETETSERDNRTRHNRNLGVQVVLTIGTWGAFVAAAVYAGIANHQLGQTRQALNTAQQSVEVTERANSEARERFEIDQRPYIGLDLALRQLPGEKKDATNNGDILEPISDPANPGKLKVVWSIHYKNYGKSPALNVSIDMNMETGENAFHRIRWLRHDAFITGNVASPSQSDYKTAISKETFTEPELRALYLKDGHICVFGHIEYDGLYGGHYWTEFCVQHLATGATIYCPSHNLMN